MISKMDRIRLIDDLAEVRNRLIELKDNQGANYYVIRENYLKPVCDENTILHMNNSHGLDFYYRNLLNILKKAVRDGKILPEELPIGAPRYLEELALGD